MNGPQASSLVGCHPCTQASKAKVRLCSSSRRLDDIANARHCLDVFHVNTGAFLHLGRAGLMAMKCGRSSFVTEMATSCRYSSPSSDQAE